MTPQEINHAIRELRRRMTTAETLVAASDVRAAALEAILLNVPADRLLGRHSTTTGPAQFIRIGTGLDLQDDVLVNTGGGGGGGSSAWSSGFSSGFS